MSMDNKHTVSPEIQELAKTIQAAFVTHLPNDDDSEDRSYSYRDNATERDFEIRRFDNVDEKGRPCPRYFVSEFEPNGRMCETDSRGHVTRGWDEPLIQETEARVGPNLLMTELRNAGVDPTHMVRMGGGLGVGSRFFPTLEECAQKIAEAIASNARYRYFEPLTPQQKTQLEFSSAKASHTYWREQERSFETSNAGTAGLFKGCTTMFGSALPDDTQKAILAYLNAPDQDKWLAIRSLIVTGSGTLWQAWGAYDTLAPRGGNVGYPDSETLTAALRAAVTRRAEEIRERLAQSSATGLRAI
jgi:hypothetical protein